MADEARHHHFIPQGYLRGFAQKRGERQWYVHVNDFKEKRSYTTNVRNVCGERDFMRFEAEGHAPDKVEGELSTLENRCIEAIRRVASSGVFEGEDANLTFNLMALLAVRSPEMRENMRGSQQRVSEQIMHMMLETKERYVGQMAEMRAAGQPVRDTVTYEGMKDFIARGQYKFKVRREHHIRTEFQLMATVLEELGNRHWTVYVTDGKSGEFITTNRPATLTFVYPTKVPKWMAHSSGFSLVGTEVHFPLTQHAMLVGRWDRGGPTEIALQDFIAAVNGRMIRNGSGLAISREKEVLYADPLLRMWQDDKVIQRLTTEPTNKEFCN